MTQRPNSGQANRIVLVLLGVIVAAFAVVGAFATEALYAIDEHVYLAIRGTGLRPPGPPIVMEIIRDITALGSYTITGLVTGVTIVLLILNGFRRKAVFVAVTVLSGVVAVALLKELFARPRPDLVGQVHHVASLSFPSGHAAKSALVYLTVATVAGSVTRNRNVQVFLFVTALGLAIAAGASRIYLGVHWPSDVVAGWLLGGGWVLCAWMIEQKLRAGRPPSDAERMPDPIPDRRPPPLQAEP